jgi:hypothetical protein
MDVRIDQAGHERAVAEVDGFSPWFMSDARPNFDNPLAANQDLPWHDHFPRLDIEHASSVKDNRARRCLCENRKTTGEYKDKGTHN